MFQLAQIWFGLFKFGLLEFTQMFIIIWKSEWTSSNLLKCFQLYPYLNEAVSIAQIRLFQLPNSIVSITQIRLFQLPKFDCFNYPNSIQLETFT